MNKDHHYMRQALNFARTGLGRTTPNPSVGCVLVRQGRVIAAARTGDGGRPHAEALALEQAGMEAKGATAYVTLEPCAHEGETPSCARLLKEAGVARVVVACEDPDPRTAGKGINILHNAKLKGGAELLSGELAREAEKVNRGFFLKVRESRPMVTLKIATSADGKIAAAQGRRTQITCDAAQGHMHLQRAQNDAIMVGVGTVLADDPLLTARLKGINHKIIRVVMDTELRLPLDSKLVQTAHEHPLFILHNSNPERRRRHAQALEEAGAKLLRVDTRDIKAVLSVLAKAGITRLLVEGGTRIHRSFLTAGFCDRFLHYKAPQEIGGRGVAYDVGDLEKEYGLIHKGGVRLGADVLEVYERCSQD